jgi:hypothetical protein
VSKDALERYDDPMTTLMPTAEGLDEPELLAARDRYYPGWWIYAHLAPSELSASLRPLYHVVCDTDHDLRLAEASKPPFVDVDFSFS